eukprot:5588417-Amphidinium_carterae.1
MQLYKQLISLEVKDLSCDSTLQRACGQTMWLMRKGLEVYNPITRQVRPENVKQALVFCMHLGTESTAGLSPWHCRG